MLNPCADGILERAGITPSKPRGAPAPSIASVRSRIHAAAEAVSRSSGSSSPSAGTGPHQWRPRPATASAAMHPPSAGALHAFVGSAAIPTQANSRSAGTGSPPRAGTGSPPRAAERRGKAVLGSSSTVKEDAFVLSANEAANRPASSRRVKQPARALPRPSEMLDGSGLGPHQGAGDEDEMYVDGGLEDVHLNDDEEFEEEGWDGWEEYHYEDRDKLGNYGEDESDKEGELWDGTRSGDLAGAAVPKLHLSFLGKSSSRDSVAQGQPVVVSEGIENEPSFGAHLKGAASASQGPSRAVLDHQIQRQLVLSLQKALNVSEPDDPEDGAGKDPLPFQFSAAVATAAAAGSASSSFSSSSIPVPRFKSVSYSEDLIHQRNIPSNLSLSRTENKEGSGAQQKSTLSRMSSMRSVTGWEGAGGGRSLSRLPSAKAGSPEPGGGNRSLSRQPSTKTDGMLSSRPNTARARGQAPPKPSVRSKPPKTSPRSRYHSIQERLKDMGKVFKIANADEG